MKITSIFDNFRIFGVDSTHNELRNQLTSAQRNIVGTNIKTFLCKNKTHLPEVLNTLTAINLHNYLKLP